MKCIRMVLHSVYYYVPRGKCTSAYQIVPKCVISLSSLTYYYRFQICRSDFLISYISHLLTQAIFIILIQSILIILKFCDLNYRGIWSVCVWALSHYVVDYQKGQAHLLRMTYYLVGYMEGSQFCYHLVGHDVHFTFNSIIMAQAIS